MSKAKKLVSVLTTSALVTKIIKKNVALNQVFYIYHPVWFKNNEIWALINFGSEVNAMIPIYVAKLCLKICYTNVGAWKIHNFTFKMFEIVLASFQIENKLGKTRFFQKSFLLTDISVQMVLEIFFLTFSNANI